MKRVGCIVLCLLAYISVANAGICPSPPAQPAQEVLTSAAENAKDHGFLWRISKGEHVSYLYGTIHIARFEAMFPGPVTRKALTESDTIALELDALDPAVLERLKQSMLSVKSYDIPSQLVARIKQVADAQCLPYEKIATLMPELQIVTLELLQARQDALYADYSVDMMLSGFGHAAKKSVVSLETPEMQMQMLRMGSQQETIDFAEKSLAQIESGEVRELTLRMYHGWESSNYKDLENYAAWCKCLDTERDRKYMQRLLNQRNIKLAESIDKLHASGKAVFAAVGSLHMFGADSLPGLIRQRGYRVEVVKF